MMARRKAGLNQIDGSLFFPDGRVNIPLYQALRDQSGGDDRNADGIVGRSLPTTVHPGV
ncbi:hypothetical protein DAPPUDRAFT_242657 [Daphnia pulex]|uniref:Uncharacterized protein n=1 Tax=Daphnia pulex TaxID=6669 RepID=E9GH64_DAPPU|nr:hypothetical protein DAPPUDRAFT_242657 [Daphnia pulex]|eukprot:EFX81149.1 hypothetical protein DAPPUDRAFT_242657 [Daphnia pulex]